MLYVTKNGAIVRPSHR